VTVRDECGRLTAYPFDWADDHGAWQGPGLLDRLPTGGLTQVNLPVIPESGLHVDLRSRIAGAWSIEHVPGLDRPAGPVARLAGGILGGPL
jgi:hypothetical protein